jgi:hypothetical protein
LVGFALLGQNSQNDATTTIPMIEMTASPPTTSLANVTTKMAYYSQLADDRSGSVIQHMIRSFGYAHIKHGTYMGACGETPLKHMRAHQVLLKSIGLDKLLPFACPPTDETKAENYNRVEVHTMFLWESREQTLVQEAVQNGWDDFTPHIPYLKQHLNYLPSSDAPLISVHIRRGDIDPCCSSTDRYLPNSYYHSVIESHRKRLPNAKVMIFSEKKSFESLESFVQKGYIVEAGGDLANCWRTMISSDVLILSRSFFSDVPKLLTRGSIGNDPWNLDEELRLLVMDDIRRLKGQCDRAKCTYDDDATQ